LKDCLKLEDNFVSDFRLIYFLFFISCILKFCLWTLKYLMYFLVYMCIHILFPFNYYFSSTFWIVTLLIWLCWCYFILFCFCFDINFHFNQVYFVYVLIFIILY
jgi:hypothetical protein